MSFKKAAINFIILMVAAFTLLFIDLYFWLNDMQTFSESIWAINQKTLALAFGCGVVAGHCFTVPYNK